MSEELKMIDSYKSIFNMCPTSPFGSVPLHLVLLEKFRLPHLRKMLNKLDKKLPLSSSTHFGQSQSPGLASGGPPEPLPWFPQFLPPDP